MYSDRKEKVRVAVYYDVNDYERLMEKVRKSKLDRSKFIRKMTLDGQVVVRDFKTASQLMFEINKIGVNINQIARKVNEFETVYKTDVETIRQEFEELCLMLNQFLFDQQ